MLPNEQQTLVNNINKALGLLSAKISVLEEKVNALTKQINEDKPKDKKTTKTS